MPFLGLRIVRSLAPLGRGDQEIEKPFLGALPRPPLDLEEGALFLHGDGGVDEIADHRIDVAAHVSDLGEFRRLHLDERRSGETSETLRDLRFADAGRTDHEYVRRLYLLPDRLVDARAAPPVPKRHRDGPFRVVLADDVLVELGDDLSGREFFHRSI